MTITDVQGQPVEREVTIIDWTPEAAEKGGYDHFMLKEIHEQPESLRQAITGRVTRTDHIWLEELEGFDETLRVDRPHRAGRLWDGLLRVAHRRGRAPGLDRHPGPRERRVGVPLLAAAGRRADARDRGHPVR